jgi:hypothetical protein
MPHRSKVAITAKANGMGLRGPKNWRNAAAGNCSGEQLERAIELYERGNIAWTDIGAAAGCSATSAQNAVLIALCERRGFAPAERTERGSITPAGIERLRELMRQGKKGVEIQLEAGVTASVASRERRAYERELAVAGAEPLPARNDGQPYSGVRLTTEHRRNVESLLLQGFGIILAGRKSGVGQQSVRIIRADLVRRLKSVGVAMPGCDLDGNRLETISAHPLKKSDEEIAKLRALLVDQRLPVKDAAPLAGMSTAVAYKYARAIADVLAADGQEMPKPIRASPKRAARPAIAVAAVPRPEPKPAPVAPPRPAPPALTPLVVAKPAEPPPVPSATARRATNLVLRPPPPAPAPARARDPQENEVLVRHGALPRPPDPLAKRGTRPREVNVLAFSEEFLEQLRRVAAGQGIVEVRPITRPAPEFSGCGSSLAGI